MESSVSATLISDKLGEPAELDARLAKTLVRRQMNQGGNIMMLALEPLTSDEFYAGGPNGISPAWTLGHLACVLDLFTSWIEERHLTIPRWSHDVFNSLEIAKKARTKAESVDPATFPRSDIMLLFRHAQVHALDVLASFDPQQWETPTPSNVPDTLPTYGSIWQSLGVHTFWHLGELAGCIPRFHGTYTLNTVSHYFYSPPAVQSGIYLSESDS